MTGTHVVVGDCPAARRKVRRLAGSGSDVVWIAATGGRRVRGCPRPVSGRPLRIDRTRTGFALLVMRPDGDGLLEIPAASIALSPETAHVVLPVRGWELPGVAPTSAVEAIADLGRPPGETVAVVGNGRQCRRAAGRLRRSGLTVHRLATNDVERLAEDTSGLVVTTRDPRRTVLRVSMVVLQTLTVTHHPLAHALDSPGSSYGHTTARVELLRGAGRRITAGTSCRTRAERRYRTAVAAAGPELVVCPCGGLKAGDVRATQDVLGVQDAVRAGKLATGLGLGICQGRLCHPGAWTSTTGNLLAARQLQSPVPMRLLANGASGHAQ